jgi:hypothetical protein
MGSQLPDRPKDYSLLSISLHHPNWILDPSTFFSDDTAGTFPELRRKNRGPILSPSCSAEDNNGGILNLSPIHLNIALYMKQGSLCEI